MEVRQLIEQLYSDDDAETGKAAKALGALGGAAALLDRLTHHCHIFEMNGESFRFRESVKAGKRAKTGRQAKADAEEKAGERAEATLAESTN